MIRLSTLFWLTLALVAGFAVYQFKYKVQALEAQLVSLDSEILRTQEATHVLAAEWSYLNEPRRLEQLSHRYLTLAPLAPNQLTSVALLPMPSANPGEDEAPFVPDDTDGIKALIGKLQASAKPAPSFKTVKGSAPTAGSSVTLVSIKVKGAVKP